MPVKLRGAESESKRRGLGYTVLNSAHCEKCTADCSKTVGEWVIDGMCTKCRQQRIAGR